MTFGGPVFKDKLAAFSPRLGVTYDINGSGKWIANVGYGRYVGWLHGHAHVPRKSR